jgi:hypothetical protein
MSMDASRHLSVPSVHRTDPKPVGTTNSRWRRDSCHRREPAGKAEFEGELMLATAQHAKEECK